MRHTRARPSLAPAARRRYDLPDGGANESEDVGGVCVLLLEPSREAGSVLDPADEVEKAECEGSSEEWKWWNPEAEEVYRCVLRP
jgi:hypothetical protein